jgi:aryl-alcohol dehydrogenase-like predicted oxidoreductase
MEYRLLGRSGLKVSTITLGTMTMGGKGDFAKVGNVGVKEARRQIDLCIDAGVNLIDTADVYSAGASEEIIGQALGGKRKGGLLIATKARFAMGEGPNDSGSSRHHLIRACEASLERLGTDVIDLYQLHQWDGATPLEETLEALDSLVRRGLVRYIGCSNYSGWHVMKALAVSEREHRQRFVSQQIHYTGRHRRGPWRLGGAGRARLAAWPAGDHLAGHRRADRGTAEGQSRRRLPRADARGAPAPRRGEPAPAALPLLAPARFDKGPPQPRRSGAAGALSLRAGTHAGLPASPVLSTVMAGLVPPGSVPVRIWR